MAGLNTYVAARPPWVGRALHRVSREFAKWAPGEVNIVTDPADAELQVVQYWTSDILKPEWLYCKTHALFYHCTNKLFNNPFPFNRMPAEAIEEAVLVASWQPMDIGEHQHKFLHIPLGADPETFYPEERPKKYKIMTSGHVAESEYCYQAYRAAYANGGLTAHVGGIAFPGDKWVRFEDVSDQVMRWLYNESEYVSALRKREGFELGAIESLFSRGGRPIIFDRPDQDWMRKWSITIHEDTPERVEEQLREVLSKPAVPITEEEHKEIVAMLSWEPIIKRFWDELLKRL